MENQADNERRSTSHDEIVKLINILTEDLKHSHEHLQQEDTQVHRRLYVRVAASLIESWVSALKADILDAYEHGEFTPSHAELAILLEETYELTDKGRINKRPYFASIDRNIRFTFDIFIHTHSLETPLEYDSHLWDSLKKAVLVRNRITHPKRGSDLTITDEELNLMREGFAWFVSHALALQLTLNEKYKRENAELEQIMAKTAQEQSKPESSAS